MLEYKLLLPESQEDRADALLFLPGYGQSIIRVESEITNTCRDLLRAIVQPPIALSGRNKFGWANVDVTVLPLHFDREQMQASIEQVIALAVQMKIDRHVQRLFIAGFSQGGVVAAHAVDQAPDVFAGAVLSHAILVPELLTPADRFSLPPLQILQASPDQDPMVTKVDREIMLKWFAAKGAADSNYQIVGGNHAFTPQIATMIETTIKEWQK